MAAAGRFGRCRSPVGSVPWHAGRECRTLPAATVPARAAAMCARRAWDAWHSRRGYETMLATSSWLKSSGAAKVVFGYSDIDVSKCVR